MGKDLVISSNRHETKVAILEDEQLVEMYFQRANEHSLVGSIYKGRVTRVLPGMQSAFVDIGLERDAFLYVSDFFEESDEYEAIPTGEEKPARTERPSAAGRAREPAGRPREKEKDREPERDKDDSRGRDRRGRRSRRRRSSRGRAFPDSKYASAEDTRARPRDEEPLARPPEPLVGAPEETDEDFLLLPGESLAKYGSAEQPTDEIEENGAEEVEEEEVAVEEIEERTNSEQVEEEGEEEAGEPEEDDETSEPPAEDDEEPEVDTGAEEYPEKEEEEEEVSDDVEEAEEAEAVPDDEEEDEDEEQEPEQEDHEQRSAKVEERDQRYLQRSSRRGRRRGRGNRTTDRGAREKNESADTAAEGRSPERRERRGRTPRGERPPLPSIADLLKEGQEILVQIAKEPLGQKGARITSHIAMPGRFVVYMPTVEHLGVSRKIGSDEERQRLKKILQNSRKDIPGGFIMRTAGEGKSEREIVADMRFLANLWAGIRQTAEKKRAPALLHHDLLVVERVLRDQVSDDFTSIWVDNEEAYEATLRFLERFQPRMVKRVRLYTRDAPVFDAFNITQEMEKALRPKVWLKSGGYIVINQTEALVAIDINTGKYVGRSNRLEDTIVKTNLEAVKEIARQMRLRDLGGIIVVDFIDMDERKNRQRVTQALDEAMRKDRAPFKILQFNDFGLVAITRKRVKQSLERTLCMLCPYCEGSGYVKSVDTIIGEILAEAHKLARSFDGEDVMLRVHPDVAKVLKTSSTEYLQELEEILGCQVLITADPLLHHEKFDLA